MLQIQSAFENLPVQLICILLVWWMIFIYHTSRSTSRQLQRLGLGLVSDAKRLISVSELCVSGLVSVSSRTKCPTSRSRLGIGHLRLGSRLGLGLKGLVHIPGVYVTWLTCWALTKCISLCSLPISQNECLWMRCSKSAKTCSIANCSQTAALKSAVGSCNLG